MLVEAIALQSALGDSRLEDIFEVNKAKEVIPTCVGSLLYQPDALKAWERSENIQNLEKGYGQLPVRTHRWVCHRCKDCWWHRWGCERERLMSDQLGICSTCWRCWGCLGYRTYWGYCCYPCYSCYSCYSGLYDCSLSWNSSEAYTCKMVNIARGSCHGQAHCYWWNMTFRDCFTALFLQQLCEKQLLNQYYMFVKHHQSYPNLITICTISEKTIPSLIQSLNTVFAEKNVALRTLHSKPFVVTSHTLILHVFRCVRIYRLFDIVSFVRTLKSRMVNGRTDRTQIYVTSIALFYRIVSSVTV